MNVSRIYTRSLVAAQRSNSLQKAAALMRLHHVGALLVTDDEPNSDCAIGIITDRDLVVQVIADGISPEKRTIGEVMTQGISTISETSDVHEAIEVMRSDGIRRLAVADEHGTLLGVLSFDDVIDAIAVELSGLADSIRSEREREIDERGVSTTFTRH
jgi:signal-transduction protein with cAMP-binding, CBS, and nucleotidyltransferase domain